jgi:hypothetical protein
VSGRLLFLILSSRLALGAVNPDALRVCQESGGLKTICLNIIKSAQFDQINLRVCDELQKTTAKLICLKIVANETYDRDLLRECDTYKDDWDVTDCLKTISNKGSTELDFSITASLTSPSWIKNADSARDAWTTLQGRFGARGFECRGYRYIRAVDPNWRTTQCWSTSFYFEAGGGGPDDTLGPRYRVGSTRNNHCLVPLECVAE